METEKKFFVYVDFRGDDGRPFYVGKGTERRVQDLQRNELHYRIKNKTHPLLGAKDLLAILIVLASYLLK